jgi:hypothetical protein
MPVKEVLPPADLSKEADMDGQAFHYSPLRFLWAMFAIAWSAFAHPFSSTVIDLGTGQVHHESGEEGA